MDEDTNVSYALLLYVLHTKNESQNILCLKSFSIDKGHISKTQLSNFKRIDTTCIVVVVIRIVFLLFAPIQ